ncbi:MAG: ABC transporter permease [Phycisphaerales bacterium]|nr:MAG: ABC transporter permease [Phycisphaerales bacterium]
MAATPTTPPALTAPRRDNPLTRSLAGMIGFGALVVMMLACVGSLPWTLGPDPTTGVPRYRASNLDAHRLPPLWAPHDADERERLHIVATRRATAILARELGVEAEEAPSPTPEQVRAARPRFLLGSDALGRDLFVRVLAGGGVSLGIGVAAAGISVVIGTIYGMIAGYLGGRVDAVMMRIVDVLYGLPYILLVVLLAVAVDAVADARLTAAVERAQVGRVAYVERAMDAMPDVSREDPDAVARVQREAERAHPLPAESTRNIVNIVTLLVAIGGVSWLTMARVIRGQTMSLKNQPFTEAARAIGARTRRIFRRHLLPNLVGPIIVYATLTVPQAILQESFLSFLGIGVMPPMPSWGNLAADGLNELNTVKARWWLLLFPCLLLGATLLALNFVGEGLREALDPRRARR